MMPVRRTQNWLPSIFNDFFDIVSRMKNNLIIIFNIITHNAYLPPLLQQF